MSEFVTADDPESEEVIRLAAACLSDDLSSAEFDRLNELLDQSEQARQTYLLFIRDSQALHTWADSQSASQEPGRSLPAVDFSLTEPQCEPASVQQSIWQQAKRSRVAVSVTAATLVLALTITLLYLTNMNSMVTDKKPQFAAWLTGMQDVVWRDAMKPVRSNLMPGQRLAFESGLVEIEYRTGAKVVIEGPAEFTLHHNSGDLRHGMLVARASSEQSKGFTISTPTASIKDLGTEFAVDVDKAGDLQLYVFEGRVQFTATTAGSAGLNQQIQAGQGIAWKGAGKMQSLSQPLGDRYARVVRPLKQNDVSQIVTDLDLGLEQHRFQSGARRVNDMVYEIVDAPLSLLGLSTIVPPRGPAHYSQPGAAYRFRINEPARLYLLVHNRGDHALEGWQRTEDSVTWTIEGQTHTDTVYTCVVQPGEVNIPAHTWRDEESRYGVPHVCLVAPLAESSPTEPSAKTKPGQQK